MEKLRPRFLLKQLGIAQGVQKKLILSALLVKIRVIEESGESTTSLKQGESYGFGVELVRNYALCPLDVGITSRVSQKKALSFRGKVGWDTEVEVLPNRGLPEIIHLLDCHASSAKEASIRTTMRLALDASDTTTLELKIEK